MFSVLSFASLSLPCLMLLHVAPPTPMLGIEAGVLGITG